MPVQTTYAARLTRGFPGMLSDSSIKDASTYAQAEATAEIPFGVFVAQGAAAEKAILPAATTAKLVGVVLHSHDYAKDLELGTVGIKPKNPMSVLRRGRVLVTSETVAAVNDRVFVRAVAGAGGTQLGASRNAAVGGETIECKNARYVTAATAGGLAEIEIDITGAPA